MGTIINKGDFKDTFKLSKTIEDSIDAYIAQYENFFLAQLLGAELFKLFKADLAAQVPQAARFTVIFEPLSLDDEPFLRQSRGMKSLILGLIWFEYVRITRFKHTGTGIVVNTNELSRDPSSLEFINKRYNESIIDWNTIQFFIHDNASDYPEENTQVKRTILNFL